MINKIKYSLNPENYLDLVKNYLKSKDLDYYDIRLEKTNSNKILLENKKIKDVFENEITGIGIRIIKNKKLGFCSTTNLKNYKKIIDDCIENTKKLTQKTKFDYESENNKKIKIKHKAFEEKDLSLKVKELKEINTNFLKEKKEINILQSNISYLEKHTDKYFVNPNSFIYQEDPRIIMYSTITAKRNDNFETNLSRIGKRGGLEKINLTQKEKMIKDNYKKIKNLLFAKPCPALKTDIILTPELVDLLAHEAIGHAAEADAVINNSSILKIGQVLAEKNINVIDDPTLKEFGFFTYDDEGILAKPKTIIKDGVVKEYLLDIESASVLNLEPNGSSRAESFSNKPIVRMSNTFFSAGKHTLKDLKEDFTGYLLDGFAGGQVDPSVGTFMFGIKFAYKYEKGKVVEKYKQASISGNILNYLKNISKMSNKIGKFEFGFCGKDGQTAFVSGSGPHMLINDAVVGGTKHE